MVGFARSRKRGKQHNANILQNLTAQTGSERPCDFGSIRFPGSRRPLPSKYARIASSVSKDIGSLLPLLVETWNLAPPCALISILTREGSERIDPKTMLGNRQQLLFARGLREAAVKTNAWVITDGISDSVSALAGRALREVNVPLLGITPWNSIADRTALEARPNGQVHLYGTGSAGISYARRATSGTVAKGLAAVGGSVVEEHMLEPNHTHFLMIDDGSDGGLGSERGFRSALEGYLCDNDVSGDEVRTPMVCLVINGDETTLQRVLNALDPRVEGAARPVLVLVDSGGAAADIHTYCSDGEALTLPTPGPGRSAAYIEAAARLLPEIYRYGMHTGNNSTPQLAFWSAGSADSATEDSASFDLAVQSSLLNDCETLAEEIMLAVAWGDPVTLQSQLERAQVGDQDKSLALEAALLHVDSPVAQLLIDFNAPAAGVRHEKLFTAKLNRYDIDEHLWVGSEGGRGRSAEMGGCRLSSGDLSPAGVMRDMMKSFGRRRAVAALAPGPGAPGGPGAALPSALLSPSRRAVCRAIQAGSTTQSPSTRRSPRRSRAASPGRSPGRSATPACRPTPGWCAPRGRRYSRSTLTITDTTSRRDQRRCGRGRSGCRRRGPT